MIRSMVSVITPTFNRPLLCCRAAKCVQEQKYPLLEHIVVHDGPVSDSRYWRPFMRLNSSCRFECTGVRSPFGSKHGTRGTLPILLGTLLSQGEFIAYLCDDDEWLPNFLSDLIPLLEPSIDFAYCLSECREKGVLTGSVGSNPPCLGGIGACQLIHRRDLLAVASWNPHSSHDDWDMIQAWLASGAKYAFSDTIGAVCNDRESNRLI